MGTAKTEWLKDGRRMKLLTTFMYIDPKNIEWEAPAGWIIDGASIPQFAWSFVGGPFSGKYREASIIHDVACDKKNKPWESVHETFYYAMRASGVVKWKAKAMYFAVYHFGPRWPRFESIVVEENKVQDKISEIKSSLDKQSQLEAELVFREMSIEEIQKKQIQKVEMKIDISPPPKRLKESDFSKFKDDIRKKDMTLDEIRNYIP